MSQSKQEKLISGHYAHSVYTARRRKAICSLDKSRAARDTAHQMCTRSSVDYTTRGKSLFFLTLTHLSAIEFQYWLKHTLMYPYLEGISIDLQDNRRFLPIYARTASTVGDRWLILATTKSSPVWSRVLAWNFTLFSTSETVNGKDDPLLTSIRN